MKALVTGATGFIGRRLLDGLERPVVLSRDRKRAQQTLASHNVIVFEWKDPQGPPPPDALTGVEAVFHLAGEPVADRRWNAAKKQNIRDSRVLGTRRLVDGLLCATERPKVLVCCSAVGIYGERGNEPLDEQNTPGDDFLAGVCREWETEAARAAQAGIRTVSVRVGVVLGRGGGALEKMWRPFRLGLGGRLGSGRQWMPWVHLDDVVGIMLHAVSNSDVSGPINATAPTPTTNLQFTKALGRALGRPTIFPMPAILLRGIVGQFANIVLSSQKISPRVAQQTGYSFQYPDIDSALNEIV